jgi:DNA recombination protein RmuC
VLIIIAIINVWLTLTKKDIGELKEKLIKIDSDLSRIDPLIRDEFGRSRDESQKAFRENREELNSSFKFLGDNLTKTVTDLSSAQKSQFEIFSKQLKDFNDLQKQKFDDLVNRQESIKRETEEKLKEIRETVEGKLKSIQDENNKKLEEMRKTVDEKLQETVEKRFNESFIKTMIISFYCYQLIQNSQLKIIRD